jgi:hypothetical protein
MSLWFFLLDPHVELSSMSSASGPRLAYGLDDFEGGSSCRSLEPTEHCCKTGKTRKTRGFGLTDIAPVATRSCFAERVLDSHGEQLFNRLSDS